MNDFSTTLQFNSEIVFRKIGNSKWTIAKVLQDHIYKSINQDSELVHITLTNKGDICFAIKNGKCYTNNNISHEVFIDDLYYSSEEEYCPPRLEPQFGSQGPKYFCPQCGAGVCYLGRCYKCPWKPN